MVFSRKSDLPCFCPVVFSASPSLISLPKRAVDLPPSLICPLPEGLGARLWGLLAAALPSVHFLSSGGSRKGWPGPGQSSCLPGEGGHTVLHLFSSGVSLDSCFCTGTCMQPGLLQGGGWRCGGSPVRCCTNTFHLQGDFVQTQGRSMAHVGSHSHPARWGLQKVKSLQVSGKISIQNNSVSDWSPHFLF